MIIKYLHGYPKDLIRDAKLIKKSGMICTDVVQRPIVETATGKLVLMCHELTFEGNIFQYLKARKIMEKISKTHSD